MRRWVEPAAELVMVAAATALVAWLLPWKLILSPTTPTGGDAHSHYEALLYFMRRILPQGRLWGWDPWHLAGLPLFQLYFPLPFLGMSALSLLLPPAVAFKLLSLAPALALPLCTWLCLRGLGTPFPGAGTGAVMSLSFLLLEANKVWGGNLASLLAGEFCYGWAFCLGLLYLGRLPAVVDGRRGLGGQALLLALVALCHAYALLFVLAAGLYFPCERGAWPRAHARLLALYGLGFLLMAFWLVPLLLYAPYTEEFSQVWVLDSWRNYAPPTLLPVMVLGAASAGLCLWLGDADDRRRTAFLLFWLGAAVGLFLSAQWLQGIDIRFGPFAHFAFVLLAAGGVGLAGRRLAGAWALAGAVTLAGVLWAGLAPTYLPAWLEWNCAGMEAREGWGTFRSLARLVRGSLDDPRVVWEHSPRQEAMGTVRAFETLPMWSGRAVLEGLYMQASLNSPFIFYLQSELGRHASSPFPPYVYARPDLPRAAQHMRLFNAGTLITSEPETAARARAVAAFRQRAAVDGYAVFELVPPPEGYAVVPRFRPLAVVTGRPQVIAYWWLRFSRLQTPLVLLSRPPRDREGRFWRVYRDTGARNDPVLQIIRRGDYPRIPLPRPHGRPRVRMHPERIEISGLTPGLPVWIRVSYHPAWRSTSGERIYRATPAFMLVFPRGRRLTLRFGYAWPHRLGLGLSLLGLGLLVLLGLRPELGRWGPLAPGRGQAPGWRRGLGLAAAGLALLALLAAGHGDATTLRRRARELIAAGQVERGRALLRRVISRYHLHRELDYSYYDLALTYYREGDYRRAAELLQDLLQRFPDSRLAPEALFHLGMSLHRLGREAEARAAKRRLLQRYPRNPWAAQARERL